MAGKIIKATIDCPKHGPTPMRELDEQTLGCSKCYPE